MQSIVDALIRALGDLRSGRVLAVIAVPPIAALLVWLALAWAFSDDWARWVADYVAGSSWLSWLSSHGLGGVLVWGTGIAAMAVLLPIVFVTAVLAAEVVTMPVIVPWIAARRFPQLAAARGGTFTGSVLNTCVATAIFAVLWIVTLPLWFTGIGALVLPPVLSAYLNQRLFRYDALADHASAEEYRRIRVRARGRLFLLGLLLALVFYVPIVNLAAPGLSALAFTHFCLGELAALRAQASGGERSAGRNL